MAKSLSLAAGDFWKIIFRDIYRVHSEEDVFNIKFQNLIGHNEFRKKVYYMAISYIGEIVEIIITRNRKDTKRKKITCNVDENISILKKYLPLEILLIIAYQNCEQHKA